MIDFSFDVFCRTLMQDYGDRSLDWFCSINLTSVIIYPPMKVYDKNLDKIYNFSKYRRL